MKGCGNIFDSITEIGDVREKLKERKTEREEEEDDANINKDGESGIVSVLSMLDNYPSSHISVDTLLKIIFSGDSILDYTNRDKVYKIKDISFYCHMCNRFFITKCSTSVSISL